MDQASSDASTGVTGLDLDLRSSEVGSTPWAVCRVPPAVPEPFL